MKRKTAVIVSFIVLLLTKSALGQSKKRGASSPNVLIILTDQWRGQALGFLNKEAVKTPNIDVLAAQSLVLNQAITNYPVCSPSRASMLTGKYPFQHQVYSNVNSKTAPYQVELPANMITWSDVLKSNGYANGYIGKWHLDSPEQPYIPTANNKGETAWNEWTAPERRHGFDYWYAYGTYDDHTRPMYWDTKALRDNFHYVDQWSTEHEADKAIGFLKNSGNTYRSAGKPFSLVVSVNPPHSEYKKVPQRYVDMYKDVPLEALISDPNIPPAGTKMGDTYRENIKYYYACMTGVDDQIGRILKQLKESGLDKNTLVIFMADHGNCLGKHDEISKNNFYEESLRVPMILRWPGHITPRADNNTLFSMTDFYPSLLSLLGLKNPSGNLTEGRDFASAFLKKDKVQAEVQFFMGAVNAPNKKSGFRGVRTTSFKLVYEGTGANQKKYLFDLKNDPFELKNVYQEYPGIVSALEAQLKNCLLQTNDPYLIR